jgi:hypothetical protein
VKTPLPNLSTGDQHCVTTTMGVVKKIDWCEVSLRSPAEPLPASSTGHAGGILLRTGALLLGPDVGKDLLHTINDGYSGFFP